MTTYGYTRVSTLEQNDIRQKLALIQSGIPEGSIFSDKVSGKDFKRPAYQRMKRKLKKGDVLVIKSIDRLGRSYEEIGEEWRHITKKLQTDIVVLDMPLLDTRTKTDLIGMLISDIVLQLLSYVAQAERENIRQRQAEGIAAAKAGGKHLGRPAKPFPHGFEPVYQRYMRHEISRRDAAGHLGITVDSFRWYTFRRQRENNLLKQ